MADLLRQLEALAKSARKSIGAAADERALEELRVRFLGKKGEISAVLRGMGALPAGERPRLGEVANRVRDEVEGLLAAARTRIADAELEAELAGPPIDVTLAGRRLLPRGHRHPLTRASEEIAAIFGRLGYEVASGPEIELDWYNFEALNIPFDHPARDMQDTFYIGGAMMPAPPSPPLDRIRSGSVLLRTHTSPVQIRAMQRIRRPPVRVICPGRVYRSDYDQTHSPMFHQVEGLCVDEGITFADLKGTLAAFARAYFGPGTRTRFRPSYFPFVEPGAEVDVSCSICGGSGKKAEGARCGTCKGSGWLELLGAGMVHPRVLENGGIDPGRATGFAFGMGVERAAMLKHGIDDLRLFFENDLRFLEQF
ncbi:MAG TPA: phenylalanine--tRNA ligase subunit alpha [Anaeromyxobacteraceae bacterium]|nr:phenylalanine--tRNA ligase subunit alpha [Anaeromyxobacteraceae bacterium]